MIDLEDRLTTALQRRAEAIDVAVPPLDDLASGGLGAGRAASPRSPRRAVWVLVAAVVASLALGGAVVALVDGAAPQQVDTGRATEPPTASEAVPSTDAPVPAAEATWLPPGIDPEPAHDARGGVQVTGWGTAERWVGLIVSRQARSGGLQAALDAHDGPGLLAAVDAEASVGVVPPGYDPDAVQAIQDYVRTLEPRPSPAPMTTEVTPELLGGALVALTTSSARPGSGFEHQAHGVRAFPGTDLDVLVLSEGLSVAEVMGVLSGLRVDGVEWPEPARPGDGADPGPAPGAPAPPFGVAELPDGWALAGTGPVAFGTGDAVMRSYAPLDRGQVPSPPSFDVRGIDVTLVRRPATDPERAALASRDPDEVLAAFAWFEPGTTPPEQPGERRVEVVDGRPVIVAGWTLDAADQGVGAIGIRRGALLLAYLGDDLMLQVAANDMARVPMGDDPEDVLLDLVGSVQLLG